MAIVQLTLEQLMQSRDWEETFGENSYSGARSEAIESLDGTATDPVARAMVTRIIACYEEDGDFAEWEGIIVCELKDSRFLAACGWCDTTGWGCRDGVTLTVASSLASLIETGLTPEQCERLGLEHPAAK